MTRARRTKPYTVHDMARRRGLQINKAKRGGWYVTPVSVHSVIYCSHRFDMISEFVISQPRIIKKGEEE